MFYEIVSWNIYFGVLLWVKDFMKCLLNYESDMLLNEAWTWKQKNDKFYSMKHEHDYV
jgi:hypothetical protein